MVYRTPAEIAEGIGNQFLGAAQGYAQLKAQQQQQSDMQRFADPNTPDIEKSSILARSGDFNAILKFDKQRRTSGLVDKYNDIDNVEAVDTGSQPLTNLGNEMQGQGQPQTQPGMQGQSQQGVRSKFSSNMPAQDPPQKDPNIRKQQFIQELAGLNPPVANILQKQAEQKVKGEEYKRRAFESERDYNEKKSADFRKTVSGLRQSIPRKQNALDLARTALESEDLSMFSGDYLADLFNVPGFRSPSGAALNLAIKENLFSNLTRVSAKAQNMWLEKVMAGAFASKGQTLEANMTIQEALEAELALDKAETEIYNQLAEEDMKKQGYEGGDIEARTFKAMEPIQKDIQERMAYRTRTIYEKEKGTKELYKLANKKAPTGTPLTRNMFQVFLKKTGSPEKAIERAKQLGYTILPNDKVQEYIK
jgi:hypothetical protein